MDSSRKNELRKAAKAARNALTAAERAQRDAALVAGIEAWLAGRGAGRLCVYLPFGSEPDITPVLAGEGRNGAAPRVTDAERDMAFHSWKPGDDTVRSALGMPEPLGTAAVVVPDVRSVIFVPALAIDRRGFRLGYGGGFYDTYFSRNTAGTRVGVVYHEQFGRDVFPEEHDVRVEWIATEHGVVRAEA